jgi:hypothetical protein
MYQSIAPENPAKPRPPVSAAKGPAFLARMTPERKPAERPFQMSFFARYCC